ncbi:Membrane-associated eicosanoid glutathione metabolism protein [Neofusicoccum parvum]|uniref:Membrane-associated eicosanoid glutathione metabolism protein n=2 Tax=Neofusicoccum parvum TaxID=310453 RepID=A0ACB5RXE8_9PEZI|nr:putative membrane-associated eicosanoid glutathione metabolism protein [Neofusicoccum parvum UCRNP2]GME25194.1 Membrane-associated eicosanoid glutathione metabolism protein [Neofusicoccum parvum]GME53952.1 Membrane-associated eicosanoid glutathione metabolism protein [Neofusicoccum parvum]
MPNYSLLSIPAMWLTAQVPHAYAVNLVKRANNNRFDNANSKGSAFQASLKTAVPAATLARYERAEAAHRNGMENLPFFAAAVLAAKWAGVEEELCEDRGVGG